MKAFSAGLLILLLVAGPSEGQTGGGEWQMLASMPTDRQELASAALNGKIYVIGGLNDRSFPLDVVEVYNPATNSWASAASLPGVVDHNNAAVAAGKLYSIGGGSNRVYVYDPINDSWSQVASMHFTHGRTAAVGVIDDKIYVAGGQGAGMTQRELEVYDPVANTWSNLASMTVPRNHNAGGVINGKLYVAGGRGSGAAPTALEVYNPQSNSWQTLAPMPTGRSGHAAGVVHGELYVFGGEVGGVHPEVEVYNPASNSWRRVEDWPVPRHGVWASVIGNKIYLAGGATDENVFPTSRNDRFVVTSTATLANISTRLKVETGENVLIGGFIVTGSESKRIILRAIGPSLPLAGTLANPRLELYNNAGQLVVANDNWQDAPNKQEIIDSSIPPSHPLESAILTTVAPGNHTAVVTGADGSTGVALVEVYDLEAGADTRLANISTRGFVQTEDNVLIGGLILDGQISRKTIVRAIGPSLGRPDALADPTLELRDVNGGLLTSNDNWGSSPDAAEIAGVGLAPTHNLESALVRTLAPGNYTAIVRGQNGIGIALVEAYALN